MTKEDAKIARRIALGVMLLIAFGGKQESYDRINLDSFERTPYRCLKLLEIPAWLQRSGAKTIRGCSADYQAIFGHPAAGSRERMFSTGSETRLWVTTSRCGSHGPALNERRKLVTELCEAHRDGRIDTATAQTLFARIDAAIPLTEQSLTFAPGGFERIEEIRRELGMPVR